MVTSRFAPAPTGLLHLGHVLSAIYVWGITRSVGGRVLLRVEDHDRQRCRPAFESALLEDLAWLGFLPDAPPLSAFSAGRCDGRQSDREAIYASALQGLRARGQVYVCECSRKVLGVAPAGLERRYPGTCAQKQLPESPGAGLRLRIEPGAEPYHDVRWGYQSHEPSAQCGDLLLRDREGNWTYQFCAAVDDVVQGVTLIIRGDDLRASTGRQLRVSRLLGREHPPLFLRHPLVLKPSGDKLSKSDGDTAVRDLRARGESAADVIGRAALAGGLLAALKPVDVSAVEQLDGLRPLQEQTRLLL